MSLALRCMPASAQPSENYYLQIRPEGYGDFGDRTFTQELVINAKIRLQTVGTAVVYILGSTGLASYIRVESGGATLRFRIDNTNYNMTLSQALQNDVWYNMEVLYSGGNLECSFRLLDGSLFASGSVTAPSYSIPLRYLGRHASLYSSLDIARLSVGPAAELERSLWVPSPNNPDEWLDTGTGNLGWDFDLLGTPKPTWELFE